MRVRIRRAYGSPSMFIGMVVIEVGEIIMALVLVQLQSADTSNCYFCYSCKFNALAYYDCCLPLLRHTPQLIW